MNTAQTASPPYSGFQPLLEIDMDVTVFGSSWVNCDRISSYVAQMISHNRSDSLLFSNLLSSAMNELLETVFRKHRPNGKFLCRVKRHGPVDRIEMVVPCNEEERHFYLSAVEDVHNPSASDKYLEALFSEDHLDPGIGLLELAVDYDAYISIEPVGKDAIHLTVDLVLEEHKVPC